MSGPAQGIADVILFGGQLTAILRCEAVALRDGLIIASGQRSDVMHVSGVSTTLVDLDTSRLMTNTLVAPGSVSP